MKSASQSLRVTLVRTQSHLRVTHDAMLMFEWATLL